MKQMDFTLLLSGNAPRKIHKEWGAKITGKKFLEILEKLPEEEKGSIEQYIKEYFQKVGIKPTDEVFISVG